MQGRESRRLQLTIVGATLVATVLLLLFVSLNPLPSLNSKTDTSEASCLAFHTKFLIIANERGYNDSIDHGVPSTHWPVLCAHAGTTLTITVANQGSEPHGFAVGYYFEAGTSVGQGANFTLSILATKTGSFLIYCTILCAVHPWMLSGLLVVS